MEASPLPETIGRYRIVRPLGHGAMGRVLLASDPVLDRAVAIKLLRDDLKLPPEQRDALFNRMRQEARASARVVHPNIVALHDMGEDPQLGLFLVFEYVEGATLKERLRDGALGPEAAAKLAREIGDALTTAHAAGVLHRDVKPENLILARTGAKIADFGIARVPDSTLTRDGGLLGTPAYSAPEAIHRGTFSPASDQFSFAATMYEALSGRRAFPGDDALAVATRITTEHPPPIAAAAGLDHHVDSVLARGLEKDAKKRWPSADDFGRALAEALVTAPRARMPTVPDRRHEAPLPHGAESRGFWLAGGSFLVGAAVAVGAVSLLGEPRLAGDPPSVSASGGTSAPVGFLASRPVAQRSKRPAASADEGKAEPSPQPDAGTAREAGSALPAMMDAGDDAGIRARDGGAKPTSPRSSP